MIISCPKCNTNFNVPDHAIPEEGRNVKCKNCNNMWLAVKTDPPKSVEEQIADISEDIKLHIDDLKSLIREEDKAIIDDQEIKIIAAGADDLKITPEDLEPFNMIIFEDNTPDKIAELPKDHDKEDYMLFGDEESDDLMNAFDQETSNYPQSQPAAPQSKSENSAADAASPSKSNIKAKKSKPTTLYSKAQKKPWHEIDEAWVISYSALCASIFLFFFFLIAALRPNFGETFLRGFYNLANMRPDYQLKFESIESKIEFQAANDFQSKTKKVKITSYIRNTSDKLQTLGNIRYVFYDKNMQLIDKTVAAIDRSLAPGELSTVEDIIHSVPANAVYMAVDFGSGVDLFMRNLKKLKV